MEKAQETHLLAEQVMNKAIQEVVFRYNAYAPIISAFRIVYTDIVETLGVDKYLRLVVNPMFLVENSAYAQGLIIHEVLHVFFGHVNGAREKLAYTEDAEHNKIANIAEDCAINQFIGESLPDGAITPKTLGMMLHCNVAIAESAETYYDVIMEHLPEDKKNALANGACATDQVCGQDVQDALDKMGIEHVSAEEVNDVVQTCAQEMLRGQGHNYGALTAFAREMLTPKVDWRPLLQATIRNAEKKVWSIHSKQTFKRTSRRSGRILLPKRYGHKVAVALSFDTSGSISQEMVNQFLSEVQNCMKHSEIKECALWHTDNYWYGTPTELEQDIEHVFQSGGTEEACMGNAERHCKADLYIHFSDGVHGNNYGFEHPNKNIEIVWWNDEIKEIRKEF